MNKKPLTPQQIQNLQMKYEIAKELDLLDKINEKGWKSLTSKESGKIGGLMAKRKKQQKNNKL